MNQASCAVTFEDFEKIDIRVGRVIDVQPFPEGRHSTHILMIDLGMELGIKKSLAKLTPNYEGNEVVGRLVLCVVNFPPRQIGKHQSEVLEPRRTGRQRRDRAVASRHGYSSRRETPLMRPVISILAVLLGLVASAQDTPKLDKPTHDKLRKLTVDLAAALKAEDEAEVQ